MYLVESTNKDQYTELTIFSRVDGKKQIKKVSDFRPYFYVRESEDVPDDYRITGIETGHTAIDGESVKKIYVRNSRDVPEVRERFSKHYEADILFTNRYIVDEIGEVDTYPLKTLYIDIELNTKDKFPDMQDPDQEVTTIAMVDSFTEKEIILYYESPECKVDVKKTDVIKKFKTEEDLLYAFLNHFKRYDPDLVSGWNVESFDLVYLIRRMAKLDIPYYTMSPMNFVKINDKWEDVTIKGVVVFDMMKAYKYFRQISNQGRAESYSLEFTAQNVLDTGKLPHEESFHEMWIEDPEKLIEYNLRDNKLVLDIDKKLQIIDFFNSIRSKACAHIRNIYATTRLVDGFLLRKLHNKIVLPSVADNKKETFQGADVVQPQPGVYRNVIGLDVKSMYPNLIKTFNIGYETFNPDGEIQITDGVGFDNGEGIVASVLKQLVEERNMYKKLMREALADGNESKRQLYNFRQYAVKVIMNSFYGYLGFFRSRLYKKEVADAVTRMGRRLIIHTQEIVKEHGYELVYGDTDSVYILAKKKSLIGILTEGRNLVNIINERYKDFAKEYGSDKCTLFIQFEKVLKSAIFVSKRGSDVGAKKKYAYLPLWIDGKEAKDEVSFTGFSGKRSDTPRIARKVQKKVVYMVLKGHSREDVVAYLKEIDRKIRTREIPDEEVGFPKGISQPLESYGKKPKKKSMSLSDFTGEDVTVKKVGVPPAIRGALYARKYLGKQYGQGSKPKWAYVKRVPPNYPKTDVIAYDEFVPEGFEIDYDKQNKRILDFKLAEIFRSAGWGKFPDLNKENSTLTEHEVK